jgi:hypothetical protein
MNTPQTRPTPQNPTSFTLSFMRWTSRSIGLLLGALILVIMVGEGGLFSHKSPMEWLMMAFFLSATTGLFLGCLWEIPGGILILVSMGGFYLLNYWASGFSRWPGGCFFPLIYLPGLLYVLCALLERWRQDRVTR